MGLVGESELLPWDQVVANMVDHRRDAPTSAARSPRRQLERANTSNIERWDWPAKTNGSLSSRPPASPPSLPPILTHPNSHQFSLPSSLLFPSSLPPALPPALHPSIHPSIPSSSPSFPPFHFSLLSFPPALPPFCPTWCAVSLSAIRGVSSSLPCNSLPLSVCFKVVSHSTGDVVTFASVALCYALLPRTVGDGSSLGGAI